MTKTDKKREKQLIAALTEVCEQAKQDMPGFEWLTHTVNYRAWPQSLAILCVFDSDANLNKALLDGGDVSLYQHIKTALKAIDVQLKDIKAAVSFDSEEACGRQHNGNWDARLRRH